MRKKLLSLLTVLCLVLGMLPATAMAAEFADLAAELGYEESEIAQYVSEDTEITADADGLVLVVAPVSVTVKDAKLSTGLLVAPGAEGAKVILSEGADVNAVIVMAKADVTVEEKAVAASVTVTAPETTVAVAGEVKTVTVAEEAEKTAVTVAETAKVETVEVSAPAAAVEVVGEVASVSVTETAAAATVTVAENATVSTLEVAAPDVKADVAGTVESVTVAETATGAELAVSETATVTEVTDNTGELTVSGAGASNVTVTDTTADPTEEDKDDAEEDEDDASIFIPDLIITDTHMADPGIKKAPLEDHSQSNPIPSDVLNASQSISVTNGENDNEFNVVITARDLYWHANSENAPFKASWVGLAIPKCTEEGYTYQYYQLKVGTTPDESSPLGALKTPTNEYTDTQTGISYDTFYYGFPGPSFVSDGAFYQLSAVKVPTGGTSDAATLEPEFVLNIAFDITMKDPSEYVAPEAANEISTLEDSVEVEEADETDEEVTVVPLEVAPLTTPTEAPAVEETTEIEVPEVEEPAVVPADPAEELAEA